MRIKAAVLEKAGDDFEIKDVNLKDVGSDEILVKVVASGVCHTDITAQKGGLVPFPAILGHEGSGIVEKIGENVNGIEIGDHVVMGFSHCGSCDACITGHPSSCERFSELNFGGKNIDGKKEHDIDGKEYSLFFGQSSFATYAIVNKQNIVKVPKDVDLSLLGPLGCGIMTGAGTVTEKLKPKFGSDIAIFGVGSVGLSSIIAANAIGCNNIIALDLHDSRLELSKELGATDTINSSDLKGVGDKIKEITNGKGVDYVIDTTGVTPVVKEGLRGLKINGELMEIGIGGDVTVNLFNDLLTQNKTISSLQEGDAVPKILIPKIIDMYKKGKFPFDKFIKKYDFEDINQAIKDTETGVVIKSVLIIDKDYK